MATANLPAEGNAQLGDQAQAIATLGLAAKAAAGIFLLLGVAKLAASVLTFLSAPLLAILGIVEGGVSIFLALILIKIGTDLRYALEVPNVAQVHLLHALDSWRDFCKTLIALAVLALLAALIRSM